MVPLLPEIVRDVTRVRVTSTVLWSLIGCGSLATLSCGLLPALAASLVIGRIAITAVLLVAAALRLESLWITERADLGIRHESVLTARLTLPRPKYHGVDTTSALFTRVLSTLAAAPGVHAAAIASILPMDEGVVALGVQLLDRPAFAVTPFDQRPHAQYYVVSPGYFDAVGMRGTANRGFVDSDDARGQRVVVFDSALARKLWPGNTALGKQITFTFDTLPYTVVGLVSPVHHLQPSEAAGEGPMYYSYRQRPSPFMYFVMGSGQR